MHTSHDRNHLSENSPIGYDIRDTNGYHDFELMRMILANARSSKIKSGAGQDCARLKSNDSSINFENTPSHIYIVSQI